MSLQTIRPELDAVDRGKIVMTKKELEALVDGASISELEIIFRQLAKFQELKWQKAKSPTA